ncbi:MAG: hypothetical protein GY841_17745 [FCB group bacterium]|nr:hypothetical protein [FCB group bacterium]
MNNVNEFAKIEFEKNHDLAKHYSNKRQDFFRLYITITLALWGGYIYLLKSKNNLADFVLIIGLISGFVFIALLISNRYYFAKTLERIEFLRGNFMYVNNPIWQKYPQYHAKTGELEDIKIMRLNSSFGFTIIMMCFGNSALIYKLSIFATITCLGSFHVLILVATFILHTLLVFKFIPMINKSLRG